jgi:hypothetical protein
MGFLSSLLPAVGAIAGNFIAPGIGGAIGGALGSAIGGKSGGSVQSGTQTVTQQQQLDPRISEMLFGAGGNQGLLAQYQALGQQPQNAQNAAFGQAAQNFLGSQGGSTLGQLQSGASNLLGSNIQSPQAQAAQAQAAQSQNSLAGGFQAAHQGAVNPAAISGAAVQAAQVNAPKQNALDLSGAYDKVINGNAGANPYLTSALQSGVDQTNASYQKNQTDLTNNLQRNVLSGIRSNSVLSGQYGGSRQGIAEAGAISDYTNQLNNSNLQLGLANSANTTGAQAQAFNQGQDRSLSALQGLSGQQYGVASQNAAMQQAANQQYAANTQDANKANQAGQLSNFQFNAAAQQQNNQYNTSQANQLQQFNAQQAQQNNQFNAGSQNQIGQFNAGAQNQTSLANLQAQQGTNSLNSANQATGLGALSGLLGQAYGYGQNQDNYALNRAGQTNSLLAPYLSANSSSNTQTPVYSNPGGNILGTAAAGLGLYNQFANIGNSGSNSNPGYNTFNVSPGTAPVNTGALQDLGWLNNIGR